MTWLAIVARWAGGRVLRARADGAAAGPALVHHPLVAGIRGGVAAHGTARVIHAALPSASLAAGLAEAIAGREHPAISREQPIHHEGIAHAESSAVGWLRVRNGSLFLF